MKAQVTHGYVYVARETPALMSDAAPGRLVRNASRDRPWLVVDHDLSSVIAAKWPGRLWWVEIVDRLSDAEMRASGSPLVADVNYTRAVAVKVIEERPVEILFGAHGRAVAAVIDAASNLTRTQAEALAAARHPDAPAAQTRAWTCWLERRGQKPTVGNEYDGVVQMPGRGGAPIGPGLSLIHREVSRSAESSGGPSVWTVDEYDDGTWLNEPWASAGSALLDAGHAFGAPENLSAADRSILAKAWREIIGPDPAAS